MKPTQDEIEAYTLSPCEQVELERQFDQVGCDPRAFEAEFIANLIRRKRKAETGEPTYRLRERTDDQGGIIRTWITSTREQ